VTGIQWALGANIVGQNVLGWQAAALNIAGGEVTGLQLGIVNIAHQIRGLQIGLVNIIETGGWLPVMVLVNGRF
jgi:hypothetical protein